MSTSTPVKRPTLGAVRTLLSTLTERSKLAGMLGTSFGGKRNYYETFGYTKEISYVHAYQRYQRQDIAKRIIDAHAQETWRNHPVIGGLENSDAFKDAWTTLMQQEDLNFWSALERADKLAGIGTYSIVLLGFSGTTDLSRPIREGQNQQLLYLQPYGQGSAKIDAYETSTTNARFGRPTMYTINPHKEELSQGLGSGSMIPSKNMKVHWTRVVHIIENVLEGNVFGTPRLMPVWNLLDDLYKIVGGSAENYWLSARGGLHIDVDKELDLDEEDAKDLTEEVEEFHHQLRRAIRTRGVNIKPIIHELPNPTGIFEVIVKLIAGSTGIPIRILLGAEAGHLASMSDRSNWADRIAERQASFAEPMVLRPIISRLQQAGALPAEQNVEIIWPSTYRMSPLEEAQTSAQRARAAANMIKVADAGVDLINVEEVREVMGLPPDIPAEGTIFRAADDDDDDDDDDGSDDRGGPLDPSQRPRDDND